MGPVNEALARANVEPSEVDEVVLVGGSSRLPRVRKMLQVTLQRDRLRGTVDPDLAVALGAPRQRGVPIQVHQCVRRHLY